MTPKVIFLTTQNVLDVKNNIKTNMPHTHKDIEEMREEFISSFIKNPDNHRLDGEKIADWWLAKMVADREERIEEIINHIKGYHALGKHAYLSDSWDAGLHDTLFKVEKYLVSLLSPDISNKT